MFAAETGSDCGHVPLRRYVYVLTVQSLFILTDVVFNVIADSVRMENVLRLIMFVIQDVALVFSVIVVFLNFVNTYVFQAGLVGVLLWQFKWTLTVSAIYTVLTVTLHSCALTEQWDHPVHHVVWSGRLIALHVVHRTMAVIHYYLYKRTALDLSNRQLYGNSPWLQKWISK